MLTRRRSKLPPVFDDFHTACGTCLDFLEKDHDFEALEPEVVGYECSIAYRKPPNVVIDILYEPGGSPWIMVSARLNADRPLAQQYPLEKLAKSRIDNWVQPTVGNGPRDAEIKRVLDEYAVILADHFPDLLEASDGIGDRLKQPRQAD